VFRTRLPVAIIRIATNAAPRLACIKPAASVHPEPGSNSPLYVIAVHFIETGHKVTSFISVSPNFQSPFFFTTFKGCKTLGFCLFNDDRQNALHSLSFCLNYFLPVAIIASF
jgi:hypothetical protein